MGAVLSQVVFQAPDPSTYAEDANGCIEFKREPRYISRKLINNKLIYVPTSKGYKIPLLQMIVDEPKMWVVLSHGTSEDLGITAPWAAELANEIQCNVVVYDYAGYGLSGVAEEGEGELMGLDSLVNHREDRNGNAEHNRPMVDNPNIPNHHHHHNNRNNGSSAMPVQPQDTLYQPVQGKKHNNSQKEKDRDKGKEKEREKERHHPEKIKPSEKNLYSDAEAVYTYVTSTLQVPPHQLLLIGRSLGSAAAVHLASTKPIAGLILVCALASIVRVARPALTSTPRFDMFANIDKIGKVKCPVFMTHGKADDVVPFECAMAMYSMLGEHQRKCPEPLWVDEADHNNLETFNREMMFQKYRDFIDKYVLDPTNQEHTKALARLYAESTPIMTLMSPRSQAAGAMSEHAREEEWDKFLESSSVDKETLVRSVTRGSSMSLLIAEMSPSAALPHELPTLDFDIEPEDREQDSRNTTKSPGFHLHANAIKSPGFPRLANLGIMSPRSVKGNLGGLLSPRHHKPEGFSNGNSETSSASSAGPVHAKFGGLLTPRRKPRSASPGAPLKKGDDWNSSMGVPSKFAAAANASSANPPLPRDESVENPNSLSEFEPASESSVAGKSRLNPDQKTFEDISKSRSTSDGRRSRKNESSGNPRSFFLRHRAKESAAKLDAHESSPGT